MAEIIAPGHSVLLATSDEKVSFNIVGGDSKLKVFKSFVDSSYVIGHPFGSTFELQGNKLVFVDDPAAANFLQLAGDDAGADNRELVDNNFSQKLTAEEIAEMKSRGETGSSIVKALIENSETFKSKTAFSQEKYLKKKERKHGRWAVAVKPTGQTLCDTYYKQAPEKIWNMRSDALSRILTLANIHHGCKALIYDNCGGIITGSAAERMQNGTILCVVNKNQVNLSICQYFNLAEETRQMISWCCLHDLENARIGYVRPPKNKQGGEQQQQQQEEAAKADDVKMGEAEKEEGSKEEGEKNSEAKEEKKEGGEDAGSASAATSNNNNNNNVYRMHQQASRTVRRARYEEVQVIVADKFDSLIVSTPCDVQAVVLALLPHMRACSSIVVYHQCQEPLTALGHYLMENRIAVGVSLSENWMREIQVLPRRSHPKMTMSGASGYILSATLLAPNAPAPAPAPAAPSSSTPAAAAAAAAPSSDETTAAANPSEQADDSERPVKRAREEETQAGQ